MKREILWVTIVLALITLPACLQQKPVDNTVPPPATTEVVDGEGLATEIQNADLDAAVGAAGILFPPAAPYIGIGVLIWRLIRKHKAGASIVQSLEPVFENLSEAKRQEVSDAQSGPAKKLVRQARADKKDLNIPL